MITIMCFPPNCTAILQPMDQNVINLTKLYYKKSLLAHLIGSEGRSMESKVKAFNLWHAVCLLSNAWGKLSSSAIKKCWNLLVYSNDQWTDEDDLPLNVIRDELAHEQSIIATVSDNVREVTAENAISNNEIMDWIYENASDDSPATCDVDEIESADESTVDIVLDSPKIKLETVINCFNICIKWAEKQDLPLNDILKLHDLRETAVHQNINCSKVQTKISQFFNK